jgi:glucan 1,3-beta-glucosidase
MHYSSVIKYLSLVACANAQLLEIPAVDDIVSSALLPFEEYMSFGAATKVATAATGFRTKAAESIEHSVAAAADTPYWLADIAHQGVAAFNPNPPGYKVFRNVKDYGAKGVHSRNTITSLKVS